MSPKMYPVFNEQQTIEAASYLLSLYKKPMDRLKLIKLLYLADRKAIQNWERPITFDTYYSMEQGQVLSGVLDLINNKLKSSLWTDNIQQVFGTPKITLIDKPVKIRKLSRGEIQLLTDIFEEYAHWETFELGNFTKTLPEYKPTSPFQRRTRTYIEDILMHIYHDEQEVERITLQLDEKAKLDVLLEG